MTAEFSGEHRTEVNGVSRRIKEYILQKFPLARKRGIHDGDLLLEGGILDSLGVLDLVGFLEQEFAIAISDEELVPENFQNLQTIAAFVQKKSGDASCQRP